MAKKKKNASAGGGFNFKEFLLFHVEKIIFALIALLSLSLVYLGITGQKFSTTQNPADLKKKADAAASDIVSVDRWDKILETEPDRTVAISYSKIARETRGEVDVNMYASNIWQQKSSESSRRGDPVLRAPVKLQGYYYSGAIATYGAKDALEDFEDAKRSEEKAPTPRRNRNNQGMNPNMMGSSEMMMGAGSPGMTPEDMGSGMAMGPGGPGGPGGAAGLLAPRRLQPAYDLGFKFGQRTNGAMMGMGSAGGYAGGGGYQGGPGSGGPGGYAMDMGAGGPGMSGPGMGGPGMGGPGAAGPGGRPGRGPTRTMVASLLQTVVVTAIVEHREHENSYDAEFMNIVGYMPGRDNPYYQGFEVQRVLVKSDNAAIAETDWVTIKEASSEGWKKYSKDKFEIGTSAEVSLPGWTTDNLSMDIPPFLLTNYAAFCGHSDIPNAKMDAVTDSYFFMPSQPAGAGGYGGPGGGYGSSPGFGAGGSYGNSMDSGYGSDMGSGGGYNSYGGMGGSGASPYGSSGDMGGDMGGSGYGAAMGGTAPRRLPSTKYKLVRFFDPTVDPNKSYRYRVRLIMYDPNFPEYETIAPKSSDLKPEVLSRVQDLRSTVTPDEITRKRLSARLTDWSAPSDVIVTVSPTPVFAGDIDAKSGQYARGSMPGNVITIKPPKSSLAMVNQLGYINFPLKDKVPAGRGLIIYGDDRPNKAGLEFVNPVSKLIKVPKKKREDGRPFTQTFPTVVVNVVDVTGGAPLASATSRDDLRTGGEIVSFDSASNQIVVSREFEDFTDFNRTTKPDETPIGPLGGPMGGASMGGGMSGDMSGDMSGYSGSTNY